MSSINFTLDRDEVRSALYICRVLKPYKLKMALVAAAVALFVGLDVASMLIYNSEPRYIIWIMLILMVLVMFFGYRRFEKETIEGAFTNEEIHAKIADEHIEYTVVSSGVTTRIDKETTVKVKADEKLICLMQNNNKIFVFPKVDGSFAERIIEIVEK